MSFHPDDAAAGCAQRVRTYDPDRFVTVLAAPAERRPALLALYAFHTEVARTRESVSEPMLGLIRLQWWREALDGLYAGTPRQHDVVQAMAASGALATWPRPLFDACIEARGDDLEDTVPADLPALEAYARATGGAVQRLAMLLFSDDEGLAAAAESVGTAWALVGLLRALPFHARWRKVFMPADLLHRHGLEAEDVIRARHSPAMASALSEVAARARALLAEARSVDASRGQLAPLLLAPLAERYLYRLEAAAFDSFSAPIELGPLERPSAMLFARLRGRI